MSTSEYGITLLEHCTRLHTTSDVVSQVVFSLNLHAYHDMMQSRSWSEPWTPHARVFLSKLLLFSIRCHARNGHENLYHKSKEGAFPSRTLCTLASPFKTSSYPYISQTWVLDHIAVHDVARFLILVPGPEQSLRERRNWVFCQIS